MKSGNLNFLEPSGPLQTCNGTAVHLSNSNWIGVKLRTSSLCNFVSFPLSSVIFLSNVFLMTLILRSCHYYRDHVSRPHKTGRKFLWCVFQSSCVLFYVCCPWCVTSGMRCVLCRLLLVARSGGSSKQRTVTNASGHGVCCMLASHRSIRCAVNHPSSMCHIVVWYLTFFYGWGERSVKHLSRYAARESSAFPYASYVYWTVHHFW